MYRIVVNFIPLLLLSPLPPPLPPPLQNDGRNSFQNSLMVCSFSVTLYQSLLFVLSSSFYFAEVIKTVTQLCLLSSFVESKEIMSYITYTTFNEFYLLFSLLILLLLTTTSTCNVSSSVYVHVITFFS